MIYVILLFTIATYHVQRLTLQYYFVNGSVVLECRFAEGSTADGCHVIFRESFKGTVKSINITKSSIEESAIHQYITLPVSGNYTVTAHDIVDGTIITNPSVVYPQVLKYILPFSDSKEDYSKYYINRICYIIISYISANGCFVTILSSLYGAVIVVVAVVIVVVVVLQVKRRITSMNKHLPDVCKSKIKLLVICCICVNLFTNSKRYSTEVTN